MKSSAIIGFAFMLAFISAPKCYSQTSMTEYNYVTKQYKIQVESGLDVKAGYKFESVDTVSANNRTAILKALYKMESGTNEKVAYLIEYTKKGNLMEYICIPHPKSEKELLDKYWNMLYKTDVVVLADHSARLQIIAFLLSGNIIW